MGQYFRARQGNESWRLLLRLRDVEDLGRLRKDVRIAEIRFAVVGGDVREAADEFSGGESGGWPAPAKTPPCRAGSKLISYGLPGGRFSGSFKSLAKISGISKTA